MKFIQKFSEGEWGRSRFCISFPLNFPLEWLAGIKAPTPCGLIYGRWTHVDLGRVLFEFCSMHNRTKRGPLFSIPAQVVRVSLYRRTCSIVLSSSYENPPFLPSSPANIKTSFLGKYFVPFAGENFALYFCMLNSSPAITARHGKWLGRNSMPTSKWLILWKWNLLYNIAPVTAVIGKWKFCLRGGWLYQNWLSSS